MPKLHGTRATLFAGCLLTIAGASHCAAPQEQAGRALAYEMAEVLVSHRAYEPAVPLLQQGLAEDPNNPRMHLMLGVVLRDRGLYEQAQHELQTAWRLEPRDPEAASALGMLFDLSQRGEEADGWHRRAIALSGERADMYNNLGFSLALRGRYDDAVAAYQQALKRDPTLHRVYNNLGFAQARLGKFEAALRSFQQAGNKASAFANLGLAYELQGDAKSARSFYEEALRVDNKQVTARRNLQILLAATNLEPTPQPRNSP